MALNSSNLHTPNQPGMSYFIYSVFIFFLFQNHLLNIYVFTMDHGKIVIISLLGNNGGNLLIRYHWYASMFYQFSWV